MPHAAPPPLPAAPSSQAGPLRLAACAVVVALMVAAWWMGVQNYLTLGAIAEHHETLRSYTASHLALALAIFVVAYAAAVALSLPGATVLTLAGGLLFGWLLGGIAAVLAATAGATLLFLVVRLAGAEALVRRGGDALARLRAGFQADAVNYLLFLRLVPAFPFWLVNLAAALAGVRLGTFVTTTALGIIPGTFAFAAIGAGLDSVLDAQQASHAACVADKGAQACPFTLSLSDLVTSKLLVALLLLAAVALLPVVLRRLKGARS